jgi:hypothetical protein
MLTNWDMWWGFTALLRAASVQALALQTGDAPKAWSGALLGSLVNAEGPAVAKQSLMDGDGSAGNSAPRIGSKGDHQGLEVSGGSPFNTSCGVRCGPARLMEAAETLVAAMWIPSRDPGVGLASYPTRYGHHSWCRY